MCNITKNYADGLLPLPWSLPIILLLFLFFFYFFPHKCPVQVCWLLRNPSKAWLISTFSNWKLRTTIVQFQVRSYLMSYVEIVLISKLADLE